MGPKWVAIASCTPSPPLSGVCVCVTMLCEPLHVHQTLVSLVLVQLVLGLNGDSAVGHVVVGLKIDSECYAVLIAIPKKNFKYVRQIHVDVHHVMTVVILGLDGVIVVQHVMDHKHEHVLVAYISTVKILILG